MTNRTLRPKSWLHFFVRSWACTCYYTPTTMVTGPQYSKALPSAANNANGELSKWLRGQNNSPKIHNRKYKISLEGWVSGPKRTQLPLDFDLHQALSFFVAHLHFSQSLTLLNLLVAHRPQPFNSLSAGNILLNHTHKPTHKWILSPHLNSSTSRHWSPPTLHQHHHPHRRAHFLQARVSDPRRTTKTESLSQPDASLLEQCSHCKLSLHLFSSSVSSLALSSRSLVPRLNFFKFFIISMLTSSQHITHVALAVSRFFDTTVPTCPPLAYSTPSYNYLNNGIQLCLICDHFMRAGTLSWHFRIIILLRGCNFVGQPCPSTMSLGTP